MRPIHYVLTASLVLAQATIAQEKSDTAKLPAICTKGNMTGMPMGSMKMDSSTMAMPADEAHKALMAGMGKMHMDMMTGMQAADIDVAFNCGMIPHHQGAISMARAELKYGKDPETRKLAEAIIKAQEEEATGMLVWLDKRSK
jgi:uncharacterized protein (DUF305 family)